MKYLTKKNIIVAIIVVSIATNAYFIGRHYLKKYGEEQRLLGARNTMGQIIQIVEQQGQLTITKDDGSQIILIKK